MPIHSMTGFGLAERAWAERGVRVHVELRSVNGRYLELKLRTPFGVASEHRLRRQVEARLGRGRVDLSIRLEGAAELGDPLLALGVEPAKVGAVLEALGSLVDDAYQASFQVSHPTSLELLRFLMSSSSARGAAEGLDPPAFLDELAGEALDKLVAMRATEGESLAGVLAAAYDELEAVIRRVERSLEGEGDRLLDVLLARSEALLARLDAGSVERERLTQELALLIARGDVGEELARIASHLGQARAILAAEPEPGQGKTLDFLSQELNREVTTIGSKITSHTGSALVIEAKRCIERIREQVQNVE